MRRTIETFTLDKVFDRNTPELLDRLGDLEQLCIACEHGDIQALQEYDRAFYGSLVELYGEARLYNIRHSMFTWMVFRYGRHENLMDSYREHKRLFDAIKNGDKEKAGQFFEENIQ